jgi:hypothetical protein
MRILKLAVAAALVAVPLSMNLRAAAAPTPVPFTTITQSTHSSWPHGPADVVVVRNIQWQRLWAEHAPGTPAPFVDFANNNVYCVFMGTQPTSGYSVNVTGISTDGITVDTQVDDTVPGPTCFVLQVLTNPVHFVQVPKINLPVTFTHTQIVTNCP